jgi:prepilin-type N-terminal cleavage/methylation domain-containing protein
MFHMREERGFTLVEVLAALAIMTFVITTSLYAFLERNKRLQQASEIILAYQALANEAEYWRRVDYAALATKGNTFLSDTAVLAPLAPYETVVKIDDVKAGVKNVTLTIHWRNGERDARLGVVRVDTGGGSLW